MGTKIETQYAIKESDDTYHIVLGGRVFCLKCDLEEFDIVDKAPIWMKPCARCYRIKEKVKIYIGHARDIEVLLGADISREQVDHVIIFSHCPEYIENAVEWVRRYKQTKPDRFAALLYIIQDNRAKARGWYATSRKVYDLSLPLLGMEDYYESIEWREKRKIVIERDGHACVSCNSKQSLVVHHRTYERFGHEELGDLTTLCEWCHKDFHSYK